MPQPRLEKSCLRLLARIPLFKFGHPSLRPFLFKELGNWVRGLKKNVSTKSAVKLPLTPIHLQTFARLPIATVKEERSACMVLVGTVGACVQRLPKIRPMVDFVHNTGVPRIYCQGPAEGQRSCSLRTTYS